MNFKLIAALLCLISLFSGCQTTQPVSPNATSVAEHYNPERYGEWREVIINNRTIRYEVIDGLAIYQGDIILGKAEEIEQKALSGQGIIHDDEDRHWPNGVVPYRIANNVPQFMIDNIFAAINHWETHTSIYFRPANPGDDTVVFTQGNGCSSFIGRQGGEQNITLANGCSLGAVIHEIGHAVGLYHEQSRCDRDDFVTINDDNIMDGREHNFDKECGDADDVGAYDYHSIMHYGPFDFSRNNQATITSNTPGITFGQRNGLSGGDIETVEHVYNRQSDEPSGLWVGLSDGSRFNTSRWATWHTSRYIKVLAADFNGDGRDDVMKFDVGPKKSTNSGLWVGLSDGTRFNTSRWATWHTDMFMHVLTGDFNGDGNDDVMKFDVPREGYQDLGLWVGLSDGSRFNTSRWATWSNSRHMKVHVGDFNCDGRDDIMKYDVVPGAGRTLGLWVGLSDGTRFISAGRWDRTFTNTYMQTFAGDFTGDCRTDALKITIPRSGSNANSRLEASLNNNQSFNTDDWDNWFTNSFIKSLSGDFNGDGRDDIMKFDVPAEGVRPSAGLWTGLSTGTDFNTNAWARWHTSRYIKVASGDFNGDGRDDVMKFDVSPNGSSRQGLWTGLSTGTGFNTSRWATWTTNRRIKVLVGDFNGDGNDDIMKFDVR